MIYDVIIIGGGMSGLSVGYFFRDEKILILEKDTLLSGATGKNAGFLIGGFGEHFARTVSRLGFNIACEIQEIHRSNHRRIRELTKVFDSPFHASGSLAVGLGEPETEQLRQSYELLREAKFSVDWLEKAETGLRKRTSALLNRDDAWIDPVDFWSKMAATLPVRSQTAVLHVENRSSSVEVGINAETFQAEQVVFCLDAFASQLVPELKGRYIPLRGQIMEVPVTRAPTTPPVIAEYGNIYWRFDSGKLVFGGLESNVPSDETGIATDISEPVEQTQLHWIRTNFCDQISGPSQSRFGTMAFTLDGFPFVGRLPQQNRYVLSGTCGLGHSYTLEAAAWLYDLIKNGENKIPHYFSSDRINTLPVYTEGDWRTLYEAWNY